MRRKAGIQALHGGRNILSAAVKMLSAAAFCFSSFAFTAAAMADSKLPDEFNAAIGQDFVISGFPNGITVKPVDDAAEASGTYSSAEYSVSVLGIIPVKNVTVRYTDRNYVIPSGESFGIRLYSDGVMVVGISEIVSEDGKSSPAYNAGLRNGDVITHIDGQRVSQNSEVTKAISDCGGKSLKITFERNGKTYTAELSPVLTANSYKAGMWVRDSVAGIGTLTYIDIENMTFAGLGHGITDSDCGEIYPIGSGAAVYADIASAVKGTSGYPGELKGYFTDKAIGELFANTETGVYGALAALPDNAANKAVPVAYRQEVEEGEATILATVDGEGVKEYTVEIEKVNYNANNKTRNMVIRVTDSRLLQTTGGIVQGMSGSPIIQNGRLVGAVTHVFVNDPTRGYGIFAENMTENEELLLKKAA